MNIKYTNKYKIIKVGNIDIKKKRKEKSNNDKSMKYHQLQPVLLLCIELFNSL